VAEESRVIATDSVPKASWEVRRRRYGDRRWLVRHTEVYELDPITDAVWVGCVEGLTVEGIVRRVAEESGAPILRALNTTINVLRRLEHAGMVELEEADE
jgi:hypothetical protein